MTTNLKFDKDKLGLKCNIQSHTPWLQRLPPKALKRVGLTESDVKQQLPVAQKDCLEQLIKAVLREQLYPTSIALPANFTIPLWKRKCLLVIQNLRPATLGQFRQAGKIILAKDKVQTQEIIDHPNRLLQVLVDEMENNDPKGVGRFSQELDDSIRNNALTLAYREKWRRRLLEEMSCAGAENFWRWNIQRLSAQDLSIFWEQWGCVGHPFHPNKKSKIGLCPEEVLALSPDFEATVNIRLAALKNVVAHAETCHSLDVAEWFSLNFPEWYQSWRETLLEQGINPNDYKPLPVHPWQADNIYPSYFLT